MKKKYIKPNMQVFKLTKYNLLTTSDPTDPVNPLNPTPYPFDFG